MEKFCCFCNKTLQNGDTVTVERGLKKLIEASIERNDGKVEQLQCNFN